MKTNKISLANIQGMLSRAEMKNIMAGSGDACIKKGESCNHNDTCCNGQCPSQEDAKCG